MYTWKPRVLSLLIATGNGSPCPSEGLMDPLYTLPNPPSPILSVLLKPWVASLSSCKVKTLKLFSFSLYKSFTLLGEDREPVELAARFTAGFFFLCNSGADLHLSLKKKHFIFSPSNQGEGKWSEEEEEEIIKLMTQMRKWDLDYICEWWIMIRNKRCEKGKKLASVKWKKCIEWERWRRRRYESSKKNTSAWGRERRWQE